MLKVFEPRAQATFLNKLAWSARWRDRAASTSAAAEALVLLGSVAERDLPGEAAALTTLGWQSVLHGEFSAGERYLAQAEMRLSVAGPARLLARALSIRAMARLVRLRRDLANRDVLRALLLMDKAPPERRVAILCAQSALMRDTGRVVQAGMILDEARAAASPELLPLVALGEAEQARLSRDPQVALDASEAAWSAVTAGGALALQPRVRALKAAALRRTGSVEAAAAEAAEGLETARRDGNLRAEVVLLREAGLAAAAAGETSEAAADLDAARRLARAIEMQSAMPEILKALAELEERAGNLPHAIRHYREIVAINERITA